MNKAPPILPDPEDIEEMDDHERERLEEFLDAITLAGNADEVREEITELELLAVQATGGRGVRHGGETPQAPRHPPRGGVLR